MKIMLAAVASSAQISGVQRHAFNAARCLLSRPEVSAVHLVVAPWQRALALSMAQSIFEFSGIDASDRLKIHLACVDRHAIGRNLWYYRGLPRLASEQSADLVHLTYPVPVNASAFSCPTAVTLHDLYPYEIPANFGFPKVLFNRIILRDCLRSVNAIACVSEITMTRLRQYVPSQRPKAVRIYNCVEASMFADGSSPISGWETTPFMLCVAQHRRNKNIPLLIRSLARLQHSRNVDSEMKLLVVGIPGPESGRIRHTIAQCGLADRVVLLDGLSEAELQWCYAHCEAVVAPSRTEGFGLPVAEALLAGCRVVCSDIPAFREAGDGHARFVPLDNLGEDALAAAMAETLATPRKAPVALPQFSTRVLGAQYVALYRRLLAQVSSAAAVQAGSPERLHG